MWIVKWLVWCYDCVWVIKKLFWMLSYCILEKNNIRKCCLCGVRFLNIGSCSIFIYENIGFFFLFYMNNLREIF